MAAMVVPKVDAGELPKKMSPDVELSTICTWGKCHGRLDRVLKKKPDVNFKGDDGRTPLHHAAAAGSAGFCRKLLEAKADPNMPATAALQTPLDQVIAHIEHHEDYDRRMNSFDQVNRLDDFSLAVRPDLGPFREVRKVLEDAGGVRCGAYDEEPTIRPDGSIRGGPASALRAYEPGEAGSYTPAGLLRTGRYDLVKYEDDMLIEAEYDPKTGLAM